MDEKWTDKTIKSFVKGPDIFIGVDPNYNFDDLEWVKNNFSPRVIPRIVALDFYYDSTSSRGIRAFY